MDQTDRQTVYFPVQFSSLDAVREFVGKAARASGLGDRAVYAVQMAVDEAFSNIIEHAYQGESEDLVECTCETTPSELRISLRDCGNSFDPEVIPDPDIDASLEERDAGGLGLFFMRELMDEVDYRVVPQENGSGSCNLLTMVKRKEKQH